MEEPTLGDLLRHQLRWLRTVRTVQPIGYVFGAVTFGLPVALAGTVLSPEANQAAALATATGILTVDLDAIVANWRKLEKTAVPAECAAVVKADAYGCGAAEVSKALAGAGCKTFFVATLDEARVVRAALPDARFARFVIGGGTPTYLNETELGAVFDLAEGVMGADLPSIPIGVEASPDTLTVGRVQFLKARGV